MSKLYLNFGAGNPTKEWINLDSSPFFLVPKVFHQLSDFLGLSDRSKLFLRYPYQYYKFVAGKQLPFTGRSLKAVYLSHVLEHLTVSEIEALFVEFERVLEKNGIIRILVPDLEGNIQTARDTRQSCWFSLDAELLTIPQELKFNKLRAALEAINGFPSFHKTLIFTEKVEQYFSKKWKVTMQLKYLESAIPLTILKQVENKERVTGSVVFELQLK